MRKISKLIITITMILSIACTSVFAISKNSEEFEANNLTFSQYMDGLTEGIEHEDLIKLENLYKKIEELEKEEDKVWQEFEAIIDKYYEDSEEYLDFEELLGEEIEKFDEEQIKELRDLYSKIIVYEKDDDYRKADLLWEEFDSILEEVGVNPEDCYDYESDINEIGSYKVSNGNVDFKFSKEVSKEDINKYKLMWHRSKKIIPKAYINRITEFEIMTDGKDETLAYVYSPDNKNKKWTLAIDIEDAFDKKGKLIGKELDETIVHEFAHILTLNDNQVIPKEEKSLNYITDEGTTKSNSYLNLFYKKFWADIFEESKIYNEDEANEESTIEFYDKYKDRFISEYAATNPEEDIAETFKEFIVSDKPKGNSIAEKKILFFYDFPELVKVREEIRKSL